MASLTEDLVQRCAKDHEKLHELEVKLARLEAPKSIERVNPPKSKKRYITVLDNEANKNVLNQQDYKEKVDAKKQKNGLRIHVTDYQTFQELR